MIIRSRLQLLRYTVPAYTVMAVIFIYPVVKLLQYAFFQEVEGNLRFTGLENFLHVLTDEFFQASLLHNAILVTIVPVLLVISVFMAVVLYEQIAGWKVYRILVFFPYILAIPVIGIFFSYFLYGSGALNTLLREIGLGFLALNWLGDRNLALITVMTIIIWKEVGLGIVVFLARLMSIDAALYEAAAIDGAGWFRRLTSITIPQLMDVIQFYAIFAIITVFSWVFNYIYVITAGGPGKATYILELYIYNRNFRYHMRGMASTAALILLFIITVFVFLQYKLKGLIGADEE